MLYLIIGTDDNLLGAKIYLHTVVRGFALNYCPWPCTGLIVSGIMNLCYIYFITILIVTISSSQCYWVSSLRSSQKLQRGRIGRSSSGIVLEMTADSMHSNTNSVPKSVTGLSSRQSILNIVKSSLIVSSATVLTSLSTARVQDASAAPMEGSIAVIGMKSGP